MTHAPMAIVLAALCSITEIDTMPASVTRWAPQIDVAALTHHVDPDLVAIVVLLESGGDPTATSPLGARGLMQVMPTTAEAIARERHLPAPLAEDLDDPVLNLDFGTYYLAQLIADLTDGDLDVQEVGLVAAGYNAGLQRTLQWQAGEAELSAETQAYRKKMMRLWKECRKRRGM